MELPTRSQHDEDAAGALAALSARQRHELERLLGKPPSIANVPQEFWDKVQQETEDDLAAILLLIFVSSAEFHGSASAAAGTAAILWARPTAGPFAASFTQTSRDMLAGYGARWEAVLATGQRITEDVIFEDTNRIFGPGRAARMAVDAVTTGQTAGGEWAIEMFVGKSPDDYWKTNPHLSSTGPCDICGPLSGEPRSVWEAEFPGGPPIHGNCVCEIIYLNLENAENN